MKIYLIIESDVEGSYFHGVYATKEVAKKYLKELYNKEYHYYADEEEDNDAFAKHLPIEAALHWENDEQFVYRFKGDIHTVWKIEEEEVIEE